MVHPLHHRGDIRGAAPVVVRFPAYDDAARAGSIRQALQRVRHSADGRFPADVGREPPAEDAQRGRADVCGQIDVLERFGHLRVPVCGISKAVARSQAADGDARVSRLRAEGRSLLRRRLQLHRVVVAAGGPRLDAIVTVLRRQRQHLRQGGLRAGKLINA